MKMARQYFLLFALLVCFSCSPKKQAKTPEEIILLQINDVYEVQGVSAGKLGGLHRVAAIAKREKAKNPNTWLLHAGDFLSPSVFNVLKIEGERVRGKQMVEAMNAAGVDVAIFGNHEFDIKEQELLARLDESEFKWLSSNVFHKNKQGFLPFSQQSQPLPTHKILTTKAGHKIGLIGVTTPYNQQSWVHYKDAFETAQEKYLEIQDSTNFVLALTHLYLAEDRKLARQLPEIPLLIGGHDHNYMDEREGNVRITKADANAKSLLKHRLTYFPTEDSLAIETERILLNESIQGDSATFAVIQKWQSLAVESFEREGFEPTKILFTADSLIDVREVTVRGQQCDIGQSICSAMKLAYPQAQTALLGSGSIRLDDEVSGEILTFDVLRMLPFGGSVHCVKMKGATLLKVLAAGDQNKGSGGYLQRHPNLSLKGGKWQLEGKPIAEDASYEVVLNDYLLTGKEKNLEFLAAESPAVLKLQSPKEGEAAQDVRSLMVAYWQTQ